MGTRAQAFTAKIKNLQELQCRLMQGSFPPPQGHEIGNSLKYFTTTLLSVLRDVPGQPLLMMKSRENDLDRLALFPSLDYKGLFNTLLQFLDLVPIIPSGLYDFGKGFFCTLCSLVPFLERDDIESLPYVVAATLLTLPVSLHEEVLDVLCWHLLPFTMNTSEKQTVDNCVLPDQDAISSASGISVRKGNYASNSASAILMMVFQFVKDNSAIQRKITECLMDHKDDLAKDLLCVIAHGTPSARAPAANLLFYYWPNLNPTQYDRRNMLNRLNSSETWKPPKCFHPECPGADAVKVCYDHTVSLAHHPDRPPPSFYCGDCYEKLKKVSPNSTNLYEDINHPIEQSDTTCENKNCRSQSDKTAVALCFSRECTSYNSNRPVRLCTTCNNIRHNTRRGADHVVHNTLPSPWDMEPETQSYLVKAVVGLLQEAVPYGSGRNRTQAETQRRTMQVLTNADDDDDGLDDETILNERRLLSRYGVWLLVGLATPKPTPTDTPAATFGHMLSMLFQWFNATAYLPNDKTGTALEKLKSESLPQWLRKVYKSHPDVFVQCVLPNPPDYAKVGGHWEILASRTDHIKEGLVRFFCLIPYDIITLEVWNQAMSHWMEAINQDVPRDELAELKSVFCKIFDPDMSPLGFDARQMYQFISERFVRTTADVQKQALQWLQKLCLLEIPIPLDVLFEMLNNGVDALIQVDDENTSELKPIIEMRSLGCDDDIWAFLSAIPNINHSGPVPENEDSMEFIPTPTTKEETFLTCYNLTVDVMNGQLELQDVERHAGLKGPNANDVLGLVKKMLTAPWLSDIHRCLNEAVDLELDENTEAGVTLVEELLTDFLQMINATIRKVAPQEIEIDDEETQNTTNSGSDGGNAQAQGADAKILKKPGLGGFMAVLTTMQSTVEKTRDLEETTSESSLDGGDEEFVVKIEEYPVPLQLVYYLLVRNAEANDADMRYYLLDSVRLLSLQCDVLTSVARKQRKFINWCQESLLTGALWKVLESSHSQVAQVAVPLLLHAVTLPGGADVFWKAIDEDFQHEDWRIRFAAVEKITSAFRFLDEKPVKKSGPLRSVLSHAFCCIIAILNDINPIVSLRATLHLGTIHDSALRTLIWCLEYQFDTVPIDRSVILKRLNQLFNCLAERKFLSWKFFAARFETIINEIQAARSNDFYGGQTKHDQLRMSASNNAAAIAAAANAQRPFKGNETNAYSLRSLSSNLKYPYKRTISAPAGMGLASRSSLGSQLNHMSSSGMGTPSVCYRQTSAPILKGKSVRDNLSKQASNVAAVFDDIEHLAANVAARTVDLEEIDKETIHLLVFLFMQFLSNSEQAVIPDEKQHQKSQPWQKAFQWLYALLGFNETERRFTTMPHKIRSAPAVNSYLANLPQVLDTNFEIGKFMLLNCVLILQKTPFPPRYATTWQQSYTLMQEKYLFQGCGFSLWHLEPTMRKNWLSSVLVIMYKYNFSADNNLGERVVGLIRIVIHTIAAHSHVCNRYAKPMTGFANRSRDLSQLSLGGETDQQPDVESQNVDDQNAESLSTVENPAKSDNDLDFVDEGEMNEEDDNEEEHEPGAVDKPDGEKNSAAAEVTHLFGLLPRPSTVSTGRPPPTPTDFELTSDGLPDGWAMQLMRSGRTLFIDNRNQVTTWIDPRTGRPSDPVRPDPSSLSHFMFESPPSPQSLMDVITVGSPIAVDKSDSSSSSVTSPKQKFFEPPSEERLLPIGAPRKSSAFTSGPQAQGRILDRVWQVFGGLEPETIPLIEEKITSEKVQVVASIHKQDSECGKEDEETTECYVGHVTHFRNDSIRKANAEQSESTEATTTTKPEEKVEEKPEAIQTTATAAAKSKAAKIEASKLRRRKTGAGTGTDQPVDQKTLPKTKPVRQQSQQQNRMDSSGSLFSTRDNPLLLRQSCLRIGEDSIADRCSRCGLTKEEYSEDEIGNCVVILNTFVNREPGLAAPLLPEILLVVSRIARDSQYSWELDSNTYIPSNSRSIAKQFIRCILHQLSGNGIFWMVFHLRLQEEHRLKFFATIANCLLDFAELTPAAPVATFMQELNEKKALNADQLAVALPNLACYMSCLPYEQVTIWNPIFPACDLFLRRLWSLTGNQIKTGAEKEQGMNKSRSDGGGSGEGSIQLGSQMGPLFDIMCSVLRMPGVASHRSLLDAMGKLVSHGLQNCSCLTYHQVASMCHLSNRAFSKDRDRLLVTRSAVMELVQALKFKSVLPDANFLLLTSLVLQDAGGSIQDDIVSVGLSGSDQYGTSYNQSDVHTIFITGACEVMRNHMHDVLEFVADVHTLSKVKSNVKGLTVGLNEDTLGGILKASLAQYVALEITKGNGRDSRSANKFLPWLFNPPANTAAQGPREFLECVAHIRLLSWLLLGSVNHTLKHGVSESAVSQPIPLEASCHIADQVQVILAGFAEQSKTSVVHMCSLFHAFILCQLWTVYLEQTVATTSPKDEGQLLAGSILLDFWGKVTPGILQLVSHSKVLAEMVNLHFLSLMEALVECNSTILAKLMPLWCPVLFAYRTQVPDHVRVRLQAVQDYKPPEVSNEESHSSNSVLGKWLQHLQFKMGQIEMQASNVTQFFTV